MGKRYDREQRGRVADWLWRMTSIVIMNLVLPIFLIIFGVFNRTRVFGRHRVPLAPNTLLLSNHQSMIDSFAVGMSAYYLHHFRRPDLTPWNPAAEENFFSNPFLAWFFDKLRCIPVRPGRRDLKAVYRSMRALKTGTLVLFPEGTRSRDGRIRKGRPGAGLVILGNQPNVLPVTIDGMDEVLPIGRRLPRIGKRIYVYIGKPIDYREFLDEPRSKETAQRIVDRVMERVRFQRRVIERLKQRGL
jgi:1-acyl-sn-glycerol-3-phosphate acyltransferase